MGLSVRIFFFPQEDQCRRIPFARFERFWSGIEADAFLEYAGRMINYVEVLVRLEKRKVVEVVRITGHCLQLDERGLIDRDWLDEYRQLTMGTIEFPGARGASGVVNASARFYKKRLDDRFKWQLSSAQLEMIGKHVVPE